MAPAFRTSDSKFRQRFNWNVCIPQCQLVVHEVAPLSYHLLCTVLFCWWTAMLTAFRDIVQMSFHEAMACHPDEMDKNPVKKMQCLCLPAEALPGQIAAARLMLRGTQLDCAHAVGNVKFLTPSWTA